MNKPLVSIIIPTFNRAHLIGETLDSIIAQTYTNWECIIVDDGSTDNTEEVVSAYVQKDSRFQFHHRPDSHKPGGNGARNYGFSLSKGEYINWFDSDDLMKANFISLKLNTIEHEDVDFVVSKSLNFDTDRTYEVKKYRGNFINILSGKNYILKKNYWMTPDFFIKKKSLKNYTFDETIQSGQETNFFIVILNSIDLKGFAINENLVLRRLHSSSIQQELKRSMIHVYRGKFLSLLNAYYQVYKKLDKQTRDYMQAEIMLTLYLLKLKGGITKEFLNFTLNLVFYKNPIKAITFFISVILNSCFNSGYKLFIFSRS